MDAARIEQIAQHVGVIEAAFPDVISRAERCFGSGEPTDAELTAWAEGLRAEAPHFFAATGSPAKPAVPEIPSWLPPDERIARARAAGLMLVHDKQSRRPKDLTLTKAQQEELARLSPSDRLSRYRAWQAEAQQ